MSVYGSEQAKSLSESIYIMRSRRALIYLTNPRGKRTIARYRGKAMSDLTAPHFTDDTKAREYLEAIRWPQGPVCPHCGVIGGHYQLNGTAHRPGLWKCADCREQFSVTVG